MYNLISRNLIKGKFLIKISPFCPLENSDNISENENGSANCKYEMPMPSTGMKTSSHSLKKFKYENWLNYYYTVDNEMWPNYGA